MRLIGNVIWFFFAGFWLAVSYAVAGVVACIFVITIPFGVASFRLAGFALWPFGRSVALDPGRGVASGIGNLIWFLVAGWWLAIAHVVVALALALTVVGIPLAFAVSKMLPLALTPFGRRIVPADAAHPPIVALR